MTIAAAHPQAAGGVGFHRKTHTCASELCVCVCVWGGVMVGGGMRGSISEEDGQGNIHTFGVYA